MSERERERDRERERERENSQCHHSSNAKEENKCGLKEKRIFVAFYRDKVPSFFQNFSYDNPLSSLVGLF